MIKNYTFMTHRYPTEMIESLKIIISDLHFILRDNSYYLCADDRHKLKMSLKFHQRKLSNIYNNIKPKYEIPLYRHYGNLRKCVNSSKLLAIKTFGTTILTYSQQKQLFHQCNNY